MRYRYTKSETCRQRLGRRGDGHRFVLIIFCNVFFLFLTRSKPFLRRETVSMNRSGEAYNMYNTIYIPSRAKIRFCRPCQRREITAAGGEIEILYTNIFQCARMPTAYTIAHYIYSDIDTILYIEIIMCM